VLFLLYHGTGHFNACSKIASTLQADHDVVFAGSAFFKPYVEGLGIKYYPLQSLPFGLGFETWSNKVGKTKFVYLKSLYDRWKNRLYLDRVVELSKMTEVLKPEVILIDSIQSTDLIVLYRILREKAIRVALVSTMPSTRLVRNRPPVNSMVLPGNTGKISYAIKYFKFRKTLKLWGQRVRYFGMDDYCIIRRGIRISEFPSRYLSGSPVPLGIGLAHIPELFLMPREFEFESNAIPPNHHYLGFFTDVDRRQNYPANFDHLKMLLDGSQGKCVYCSFGTVTSKYTKIIRSFIIRLLKAVGESEFMVIISLPSHLKGLPRSDASNIYFVEDAPQMEILRSADLFITHGGLNSIKEAITFEVPMLVYPLDANFDQKSNSSRVLFHHMGLRGDLRRDGFKEIRDKIDAGLQDHSFIEGIRKMKAIDSMYTPDQFRSVFDLLGPIS
jgi:UDP:flavonoid glycosyltransferase YjiC (YdhE family)